jgi:hypothetical protein
MSTTSDLSTQLTLANLNGQELSGWLAALGAARALAGRYPDLHLHWDHDGALVLTGGPATVDEAADAIRAVSLDRIPVGGVLPDVEPTAPQPGEGWHGATPWGGPDGALWWATLAAPAGQRHPLLPLRAAQTVRGVIDAARRVLDAHPALLVRALDEPDRGRTPTYRAGMWLEYVDGQAPTSSPGRDWLALMALPWLPAMEHHDPRIPTAACAGWGRRRLDGGRTTTYLAWTLWSTPIPAAAAPAVLSLDPHWAESLPAAQVDRGPGQRGTAAQPPLVRRLSLLSTGDPLEDVVQRLEFTRDLLAGRAGDVVAAEALGLKQSEIARASGLARQWVKTLLARAAND